ncbi:MAG: hypothetical protein RI988_2079 [Pseudomonadota bacterium]|jgi:hypothetical protein
MSNPPPASCRNCGAALDLEPAPDWCPRCGQETRLHPPTLREFAHEFIGHYVAVEGALWRTLKALVLQPGRLTREYLDGRRRHYVLPLRLYLSASFLFFLLVKLTSLASAPQPLVSPSAAVASAAAAASTPTPSSTASPVHAEAARLDEVIAKARACLAPDSRCPPFQIRFSRKVDELSRSADPGGELSRRMTSVAPYAVFLMLPVFAGVMQWANRRARLPYGAHYVFGLHLHALWFLVLLAMEPLPASLTLPMLAGVWLHGIAAMRRVYGLSWARSLWSGTLVTLLYGTLLSIATVLLTAWWLFA